jgi:hypothetical protein
MAHVAGTKRLAGGAYWLIDFTPGAGVGNARPLTGSLSPFMDLAFTFSNNPATPYHRGHDGGLRAGHEHQKTYTNAGMNEPRIDRAGRYVGLSINSPLNGLTVWDWNSGTAVWSTPGDPGNPLRPQREPQARLGERRLEPSRLSLGMVASS